MKYSAFVWRLETYRGIEVSFLYQLIDIKFICPVVEPLTNLLLIKFVPEWSNALGISFNNESMPDIDFDSTITSHNKNYSGALANGFEIRGSSTTADDKTLTSMETTYPELLPTNLPLLSSIIHLNASGDLKTRDKGGGGGSSGSGSIGIGSQTIGLPIKFSSSTQNLPASHMITLGNSSNSSSAGVSSGKLSSKSSSASGKLSKSDSAMLNYIYDSYAPNRHKHYDFR